MSVSRVPQSGLLIILASYFLWSVNDACIKAAIDYHLKTHQILAIAGFFISAMLYVKMKWQKQTYKLWPRNRKAVYLRALLSLGMTGGNYIAWAYLDLAPFYVIAFSAPLLIALGGAAFLKEPLSPRMFFIILLGLVGVVISLNPVALLEGHISLIGVGAALGGTILFAIAQLMLRHLSQTETPETLIFINVFVNMLVGGALCLFDFPLPEWRGILLLFFACVFNLAGNYLMVEALHNVRAATVGAVHYTQIIPGAIFGYLFWQAVPSNYVLAGAGVIILSGLLLAWENRRISIHSHPVIAEA